MFVTLKDVAELAGVTPATVSRVLNKKTSKIKVSPKTAERVLKAVVELDYQPHALARGLALKKSYHLGLVIPYGAETDIFSDYYFMKVISGMEEQAMLEGYSLVLFFLRGRSDYTEFFNHRGVDGLILIYSKANDKCLLSLSGRIPFILVNGYSQNEEIRCIDTDNVEGAFKAVEHLIELGHRRIAMINGSLEYINFIDRFKGYKLALERYGIGMNKDYVVQGSFNMQDGVTPLLRLFFLFLSDRQHVCG